MKFVSTTFFFFAVLALNAQTVRLVDNTPSKPGGAHVYSNLQTAINASVAGDIIHVKPSSTSYGNITITAANDSITLYGIGLNPDKEILQQSMIGQVYLSGANNVKISGFYLTTSIYIGYPSAACANLSFENNQFEGGVYVSYSYATSNVLFRNCIFNSTVTTSATNSNNTVINNCIFDGYNGNGQVSLHNGTLVSHCLFFGNGSYYAFGTLQSSTISNSVFYGKGPGATTTSNSTFNNCYAASNASNVFPTANGNSVNGTVTAITGTLFTDTDIVLGVFWNVDWDVTLGTTSLAGGDDATPIGLTGGTIPYSTKAAPLPYIKSFVVPSVIKQGDNLNVKINALGN